MCSPQWTDLCGLWFWWLNCPELPGQREGMWPISPEGLGRCCERSRWLSPRSSPWSLIGWELEGKQNGQQWQNLIGIQYDFMVVIWCSSMLFSTVYTVIQRLRNNIVKTELGSLSDTLAQYILLFYVCGHCKIEEKLKHIVGLCSYCSLVWESVCCINSVHYIENYTDCYSMRAILN